MNAATTRAFPFELRPPAAPRPTVHVHIERLVFEDWPSPMTAAERARLEAALVAGITQQFAHGELPAALGASGAVAALRGTDLRLAANASPAATGRGLAHAIRAGLGGGPAISPAEFLPASTPGAKDSP